MIIEKAKTKRRPSREILKKIIDRDAERREPMTRAIKSVLDGRPPFTITELTKSGRGGARNGAGAKPKAPARSVKIAETIVKAAAEASNGTDYSIRDQIEKWATDGMRMEKELAGQFMDKILFGKHTKEFRTAKKA